MKHWKLTFVLLILAAIPSFSGEARAGDYLNYLGAISIDRPMVRFVANPTAPEAYGITEDGDVLFISRLSMSVENVVPLGGLLTDVDEDPSTGVVTADGSLDRRQLPSNS